MLNRPFSCDVLQNEQQLTLRCVQRSTNCRLRRLQVHTVMPVRIRPNPEGSAATQAPGLCVLPDAVHERSMRLRPAVADAPNSRLGLICHQLHKRASVRLCRRPDQPGVDMVQVENLHGQPIAPWRGLVLVHDVAPMMAGLMTILKDLPQLGKCHGPVLHLLDVSPESELL